MRRQRQYMSGAGQSYGLRASQTAREKESKAGPSLSGRRFTVRNSLRLCSSSRRPVRLQQCSGGHLTSSCLNPSSQSLPHAVRNWFTAVHKRYSTVACAGTLDLCDLARHLSSLSSLYQRCRDRLCDFPVWARCQRYRAEASGEGRMEMAGPNGLSRA